MPFLIVLLILAAFGTVGYKVYSDRMSRVNKIIAVSNQYGVDPALSLGIAEQESKFTSVLSSDGLSSGIFQIEPASAQQVLGGPVPTLQDLIDDEDKNIQAGVLYIKWLVNQFYGDTTKAIAAYNHGIGNVRAGHVDLTSDNYVRLVESYTTGWRSYLENV